HVQGALPLSRFLVDAAGDGCDLGQAEGRARMAANARPLWSALPDGALKRQLLGELAELAQLTAADLSDLWNQAAAQDAGRHGGGARSQGAAAAQGAPAADDAPPWGGPPDGGGWAPARDDGYGHGQGGMGPGPG
ncbi:hypothetical protein, partial [Shigella flexneri]|uniref:hypothetical protein n=1 Tax=Shigella flexneri TaxID=623 RepID=UPI001C0A8B00